MADSTASLWITLSVKGGQLVYFIFTVDLQAVNQKVRMSN